MNEKAFTLTELLSVIIIVAIIAIITVPVISNIVNKSRQNAFVDSAYALIAAANEYRASAILNKTDRRLFITYPEKTKTFKVSGKMPDAGNLSMDKNGDISLKIWSDGAKICIVKDKNDTEVTISKTIKKKSDCHL